MTPERRQEINAAIEHKTGPASDIIRELLAELDRRTRQRERRGAFAPPSMEDVRDYFARAAGVFRNGSAIKAAETFMDYHSARGWELRKGVRMSDWQAACRTFERNGVKYEPELISKQPARAAASFTRRISQS